MAGFYPVDHGDMDHKLFGGARRFNRWEAYCWLLDHAAFDKQDAAFNGKPVNLDRGQLALSIGSLAKAWKWPKSSVQRFLEGLEREGFIVYLPAIVPGTCLRTEARTGATIITLCKYYANQTVRDGGAANVRTEARTTGAMTPYVLSLNKGIRKNQNHHPSDGCQRADEPRQDSLFPTADVVTLKVDQEQAAFDAYNALATAIDLRTCRSFSPQRRAKMRLRLREVGGIDGWMIALDKISESHFIRTWRTTGWSAFGLHSLLQQETLEKLMDDAYNTSKRATQVRPETDNQRSVREYREQHGEDSFFHDILSTGTRKP